MPERRHGEVITLRSSGTPIRVVRRASQCALVALVLVAASGCSSDDPGSSTSGDPAASEPSPPSDPAATDQVDDESDEPGSPTRADENSDAAGPGRVSDAGVTFEYDPSLLSAVGPAEVAELPMAARSPASFEIDLIEGGVAELEVVPVRTVDDAVLSDLSPVDEEAIRSVETGEGSQLGFVNGTGVRDDGGTYRYRGLTDDDLVLVRFTSAEGASDQVTEAFDGLIASLFVDTAFGRDGSDACRDDYAVVEHLTVPDGTVVDRGSEVTKTWRIRNSGDCDWDERWSWAFTGGAPVTMIESSSLAGVAAGEETEVSATFIAPDEASTWAAQWQPIGPGAPAPIGPPAVALFATE